jgi:alanine racemase
LSAEDALSSLRPARASVDLDRLAANFATVAAYARVPLMPVIKADAYGHGAAVVGRYLETLGAPMLAVAYVEEGVALRTAGVTIPVLVLAGFTSSQVPICRSHELTPVISTRAQIECFLAPGSEHRTAVHVKVDTGMSRLGFAPAEIEAAVGRLLDSGQVEVDGLMTQLASADEDEAVTARQLDLFDDVTQRLATRGVRPRWIHAANSAGLARLRPTHTLGRPGLLLYGLKPRPLSPPVDVRPIMTVEAAISLVKEVPAGTAVSYGGRFVARRPSRIATIPLGYADGVPRTAAMATAGRFSVNGARAPVTGTVCMDLTMIDVTDQPDVQEGDQAVLFGDEPTAWDVAEWAGTNAWDVLTRVGSRVPRVYVSGGGVVAVESYLSR